MLTTDALKHRLDSLIRHEKNKADSLAAVKADINAIHAIAGPMVEMVVKLAEGITDIYERSGYSASRLVELDPMESAGKLADLRLMISHLEMLGRLRHVDAAARVEVLDDELIDSMIMELNRLPGGPAKIALMKASIEKLESTTPEARQDG